MLSAITATFLGNEKEVVDYLRNRYIKGKDFMEARHDALHDIDVNKIGRITVFSYLYHKIKYLLIR